MATALTSKLDEIALQSAECCVRLGQQISGYQGVFSELDCECAVLASLTTVWGESPACTEDGSFTAVQCKAGKCYCVDRYGRQCAKEVSLDSVDSLPCKDTDKAPLECMSGTKK